MVCVHDVDFFFFVEMGRDSVDINSPLVVTKHQISRSFIHLVRLHILMRNWALEVYDVGESRRSKRTVNDHLFLTRLDVYLSVREAIVQPNKISIFISTRLFDTLPNRKEIFLSTIQVVRVDNRAKAASFLFYNRFELSLLLILVLKIVSLDEPIFGTQHYLSVIVIEIDEIYLTGRQILFFVLF